MTPNSQTPRPTPTPRTNPEASDGWTGDAICVSADFARQLERDLSGFLAVRGYPITPDDTADSASSKVILALTDLQAMKSEVDALKAKNSDLHRRSQQAESAVKKTVEDWQKHGGPRGGSFGRALLACECTRLNEKLAASQSALHRCLAATGEEAGDLDDFRALVGREEHTVKAVQEMRKERDQLQEQLRQRDEQLKAANEDADKMLHFAVHRYYCALWSDQDGDTPGITKEQQFPPCTCGFTQHLAAHRARTGGK